MARPYVVKVLPLGDSIMHGFGSTNAGWRGVLYASALAAGTPIFHVGQFSYAGTDAAADPWHSGQDGATCAVIGGNAPDAGIPNGADIVMVMGGTNDIATGSNAATTAAAYSTMLDSIYAFIRSNKSWAQILAMNILRRTDGFNSTVIGTNALLPGIVAGKSYASQITYFDCYGLLADADYSDGIHPLASGNIKIGNALWPVMSRVVQRVLNAGTFG